MSRKFGFVAKVAFILICAKAKLELQPWVPVYDFWRAEF